MDTNFQHFFKNRLTADTAHQFQMQGFANGDLSLQPIQFSGKYVTLSFFFQRVQFKLIGLPSSTQNFLLKCGSCGNAGGDLADGCSITHVETGLCVTDGGSGSTLTLTPCAGTFNQEYNFHSP